MASRRPIYERVSAQVERFVPFPESPLHVLLVIAVAIFLSETFIMFTLARLPEMSTWIEAVLDSTLLIILVSPVLFGFLFLPLLKQIRKRDEAEAALRINNHLLQTVFDGISEPLILMDAHQRVKMVNAAAATYYQLDERAIFDAPCHQALMGKPDPCEECDIPERIASGKKLVFERPALFDPEGTEEVVIYRGEAQMGTEGATIVRITDITEDKALEKQLRQRERMASLGLMISGVAHEINNPNNFISFNLPILRDYLEALMPMLDEKAASEADLEFCNMPVAEFRQDLFKLIDNMSHGSQRIDAIVSRLKDFARIRDTQKLKPVAIHRVAERAVTMVHSEIRRHIKSCTVEIPEGLPKLITDGQAIEQILVNLLLNACQATNKPKSWVRLSAAMDETTQWLLRVSVADNGSGMDAETQRHIFDPLFTTNGSGSGTGLGLYIVHNLVENLEGRIEVKSSPGEGSTFHLFFPDLHRLPKPPPYDLKP